jgi:hypothetical protein
MQLWCSGQANPRRVDAYDREMAVLHLKQYRTDSKTLVIIAVLAFVAGLGALADTIVAAQNHRMPLDIGLLGLIAGPGLLIGGRWPYWIALVIATVQIILTVSALMATSLIVGMTQYYGFGLQDLEIGLLHAISSTAQLSLLLWTLLVSWWMFRVLREPHIRKRFGV